MSFLFFEILVVVIVNELKLKGIEIVMFEMVFVENKVMLLIILLLSVKFIEFFNLDLYFFMEIEYLFGRWEFILVVKLVYDESDL